MWAIAKTRATARSLPSSVAERFGMNERTAYRRLAEFREVWGPPGLKVGYETPDEIADIADRRLPRRRKTLEGVIGCSG